MKLCGTCEHPLRSAIDDAVIAAKYPLLRIAKRYGLTQQNLWNHKKNHLGLTIPESTKGASRVRIGLGDAPPIPKPPSKKTPPPPVQVIDNVAYAEGDIEERFRFKLAHAEALGKAAEEGKDWKTGLLAIREWRQLLETQQRVMLRLSQGEGVDVTTTDSWQLLQGLLVEALENVPGAIEAVTRAITRHKTSNAIRHQSSYLRAL